MNSKRPTIWKHPAVRAFCERTRSDDPIVSIRAEAGELVARSGIVQPPFSPFVMGSLKGILSVKFQAIGFDACLIPMSGGFEVKICSSHAPARQLFSMAHELGHLLMMDPGSAPKSVRRETNIGFKGVDEEEYLCDIAASELLMPTPFFEKDAHDAGPSLSAVLELAGRYKTSIAATVRRFVTSGVWKCFFVVWKVSAEGSPQRLKLEQVIANNWQIADRRAVFPRDETHMLTAVEARKIVRGNEWLQFDGVTDGKYYVETVRIGSPSRPRLLSMVITEPAAGLWSISQKTAAYQLPLSRLW